MATIDKTYLQNYEDYSILRGWCKSQGQVTDKYGNKFSPINFLCKLTKEEWDSWIKEAGEIPIWNTPTYFDFWLMRNCPFNFIQERLEEQYSKEYIEKILVNKSEYDTYNPERSHRFSIKKVFYHNFRDDDLFWWITCNDPNFWYNEDTKQWYHRLECREWNTNVYTFKGNLSRRKLARLMKRWNLPKGTRLTFDGTYHRYTQKKFYVTVI